MQRKQLVTANLQRLGNAISSHPATVMIVASVVMGVASPRPARSDQVTNTCGACTITYCLDNRLLTTDVSCTVARCVDVPRINSTKCNKKYKSSQGFVASTTAEDSSGEITGCSDVDECDGATTTCREITYLERDEFNKLNPGDTALNSLEAGEEVLETVMTYDCTWTGSEILYDVTNGSANSIEITWAGTPLNGVVVNAFGSEQMSIASESAPSVIEGAVALVELPSGAMTNAMATTFVASIPTVSEWGLIIMTLLCMAIGTILLLRSQYGQMPGTI